MDSHSLRLLRLFGFSFSPNYYSYMCVFYLPTIVLEVKYRDMPDARRRLLAFNTSKISKISKTKYEGRGSGAEVRLACLKAGRTSAWGVREMSSGAP